MRPLRLFIYLSALILTTASCTDPHFFFEKGELPSDGWRFADTLSYNFMIEDTTDRYDIQLYIDHSPEYNYQNLYLQIFTQFPDGKQLDQTLSVDLADNKGGWYGDCSGSTCNLQVVLQQNAIFNQIGSHTLKITQYMRHEPIEGVDAVSLVLDQSSSTD